MKQRLALLQETLHRELPLTRTMGVRVEEHDGRELVFLADFAPNINIHGTAFGGSLYSICAVVCWGMLHLKYEDEGLHAHSVLGDARISYRLPVRGEIRARCRLPADGSYEAFIENLRAGKRSRIELTAEILVERGVAVRFIGSYSAST
ncbi:YiiD C-terminal domain-containing protein [Sedimenticola hydrogenitrophicus]|uniref:YiiD C-terminal domain-containing protein n=1 Tax=Sedimenticola hydrogenitrophicus TaxID=2967975 RepID=UPI0023B06D0F|nr:YiiD C-terminal domain-containing protein [Sedimenticola hydrogenitrophicus]